MNSKAIHCFLCILVLLFTTGLNATTASTRTEEGFITTEDGIKLHYRKTGDGPKKVIIPLSFIVFDDFKRFADSATLVFYDMRNRGRSDYVADEKKISLQHDVQDLETVRRHFGIEKCSLIGYSYLGMMVVLYTLEHPQNVERIIQLGPVPMKWDTAYPKELTANDSTPAEDPAEMQKLRELEKGGYHKDHPKEFCQKEWMITRYRLVGDPANVERLGPAKCDMPNEWWINFERHLRIHFGGIQKYQFPKDRLVGVKIPVLTIHGTKDRNAPYGAGREWALLLPNARLLTVKGAAHQSWADAPDLVFSAIGSFLKGQWPEGVEQVTSLTAG